MGASSLMSLRMPNPQLSQSAGGAAVTCLGHGYPAIIEAIKTQADTMSCECASSARSLSRTYGR
jgi:acetylornithine/succinyldiaminopimelate/putrescine aminotransferase